MFFSIKATPRNRHEGGGWWMERGGARAVIIDKSVASNIVEQINIILKNDIIAHYRLYIHVYRQL